MSPNRPHYLTSAGEGNGTYVRIGSTNRRADPPLIEEMRRSARFQSFDELPMVDLPTSTIDLSAAREAFAPVRTLQQRDLASLGCLTESQSRFVPTVGGVLLFGRDRHASFPDAWMQVARFAGPHRARITDYVDLSGRRVGHRDRNPHRSGGRGGGP